MRTRLSPARLGFALALAVTSACSGEVRTASAGHVLHGGGIAWVNESLESACIRARGEQKLVFVDFRTSWCGWCKRLDRDTFSNAAVIRALNERCVCVSIDAESMSGARIAQRYQVSGFPTLLFLASDGEVRHKIGGYVPPDRFQRELAHVAAAR